MRTVCFLSHCPSTDSPWIISEWLYIERIACITLFTYKSSTLLPCCSAELFQAESDAQCETIRSDIFFSYQLCQLLENSLCFWGSFFFFIQIQLTFTKRQVFWPSQYPTVPQRLFCGRVCLLHMATTLEDQEVLKEFSFL